MNEGRTGRIRLAAALAAAGGSAAVFGSVLDWAAVNGRRGGVVANGTDLFASVTVAGGLIAVVAGLLALAAASRRIRTGMSALVLLGGLVAAGIGIYVMASDQVVIDRLAGDRGSPRAARRAEATPRAGLYLVLAGGVAAAAGGITGLLGGGGPSASDVDAGAGAGDNTGTRREGKTT
jgi:hypothetical protein